MMDDRADEAFPPAFSSLAIPSRRIRRGTRAYQIETRIVGTIPVIGGLLRTLVVAAGLAWQWTVWETRGMETAGWELPPNSLRQTAPADPDLLHLARPEWYARPLSELCSSPLPSERW